MSTLDSERWIQCDVSTERQLIISRLANGSMFLLDSSSSSSSTSASTTSTSSARTVAVDGQAFATAWSALLLVEMLIEYIGELLNFLYYNTLLNYL